MPESQLPDKPLDVRLPDQHPGRATRWWRSVDEATPGDRKIVCELCPRYCKIPEGQRGFCYVRGNDAGRLVLTTWGRSSGFCIDPIEKKPLNHFLPGTPVMSLGTAGCNLGCKFCQNWDISKSREMDRLTDVATPEAVVDAAKRAGCRSLAFTYNDPTIWAEYAIDIAREARAQGLKTVAVSAGYITPEARSDFYRWIDAANIDLKAFTDDFYRRLTQTHLQPVLDTLTYLKRETNVWVELTTLVIPGENDSPDEIAAMCDWVVEHLGPNVPMHFSAFHPDFKMQDHPPTPHETLIRAREQALEAGVRFAYVGNIHDPLRDSTWCPDCGELLIERDWYRLGRYQLETSPASDESPSATAATCPRCHGSIPGVFEATPGRWGARRAPIRVTG